MDDEFFATMDTIENTLKSDSGSDEKLSFYEDNDDEELEDILNKMGLEMKRG